MGRFALTFPLASTVYDLLAAVGLPVLERAPGKYWAAIPQNDQTAADRGGMKGGMEDEGDGSRWKEGSKYL